MSPRTYTPEFEERSRTISVRRTHNRTMDGQCVMVQMADTILNGTTLPGMQGIRQVGIPARGQGRRPFLHLPSDHTSYFVESRRPGWAPGSLLAGFSVSRHHVDSSTPK